MRKFLAAAILATLSTASMAATWTGTLSNVPVTFAPSNTGVGEPILILKNIGGASCVNMVFADTSDHSAEDIRKLADIVIQAKSAVAQVTIEYSTQGGCKISSITR